MWCSMCLFIFLLFLKRSFITRILFIPQELFIARPLQWIVPSSLFSECLIVNGYWVMLCLTCSLIVLVFFTCLVCFNLEHGDSSVNCAMILVQWVFNHNWTFEFCCIRRVSWLFCSWIPVSLVSGIVYWGFYQLCSNQLIDSSPCIRYILTGNVNHCITSVGLLISLKWTIV